MKYEIIKNEIINKINIVINYKKNNNEFKNHYVDDPKIIYENMYNTFIINELFDDVINHIIYITNNSLKEINHDDLIEYVDEYIEL